MIKRFASNLIKTAYFKGTFSEKISILFTLSKLLVKRKLFRSRSKKVKESFLNYRIIGYSYATLEYLFKEIFISDEYQFRPRTIQPVIVDCGANIGISIMYFKRLFPDSSIIAFEANPYAFELLKSNVELNKLTNVKLYNLALYDKESEIPFFIEEKNIGTLVGSIKAVRGGTTQLMIKSQRLSHYLKSMETVDLVKMDVEGAELNIINDLFESSLINKANEYIIEYHHNMNGERSALSAFLQKFELNGFDYSIKANFPSKDTFQDIRIHFYKK